nr:zinc finger, CCHC-type [Tanacetum cinerariifolium]
MEGKQMRTYLFTRHTDGAGFVIQIYNTFLRWGLSTTTIEAPDERKRLLKWAHATARTAPDERKRWSLQEEILKPFEVAYEHIQDEINESGVLYKLEYKEKYGSPGFPKHKDWYPHVNKEHIIYTFKGKHGLYEWYTKAKGIKSHVLSSLHLLLVYLTTLKGFVLFSLNFPRAKIIFGLNVLSQRQVNRDGTVVGLWNSSNTEALMKHTLTRVSLFMVGNLFISFMKVTANSWESRLNVEPEWDLNVEIYHKCQSKADLIFNSEAGLIKIGKGRKKKKMAGDGSKNEPTKDSGTSTTFQCPVLNSTNYTIWAVKIKALFNVHGIWEAVEPTTNAEVDQKKNNMAITMLYQAIPENLVLQIASLTSAKEIWEALKVRHVGIERVKEARVQTIESEFESLKM